MKWSELLSLNPLRINLGGRHDHHPRRRYRGWVSLDRRAREGHAVRCRLPRDLRHLPDCSVDAALTEHFVEHLNVRQAKELIREVHRVLKPGSWLRVAVPDLYHPNLTEHRRLGYDPHRFHHSIWSWHSLTALLVAAGFGQIELVHWWERRGDSFEFNERPVDWSRGWVGRCPQNDKRNREGDPLRITSLIIDARRTDVRERET